MMTQKRKRSQTSLSLASQYRDLQAHTSKRSKLSQNPIRIAPNNNSARRKRSKGLSRPMTPLSFTLSTSQTWTAKPASPLRPANLSPTTSAVTNNPIDRLRSIIRVLSLIIRRNKNQHRNQPFWKHLSLLHRILRKLLTLEQQILSLSSQQQQQQHRRPSSKLSAEDVRKRFEAESQLRSQKDVVEEHLREVLLPECYIRFSVVVADTQFANLGVVLVGLIADVGGVVGLMRITMPDYNAPVERKPVRIKGRELDANRDSPKRILGTSMRVTGEDRGEIVERIYGISNPDIVDHDEQNAEDLGEPMERSDSGSLIEAESPDPGVAEATVVSQSYQDYNKVDEHDTVKSLPGTSNKQNDKRHSQPKQRPSEHDNDSFGNRSKSSRHILPSASTPTAAQPKADTKAKLGKPTEKKKKKASAFDDLFKGLV